MQIPEVLQDKWLLVVLFALFVGPQALFSRNNAENLWLFGWIYRRIKDRKINALQEDDRIDSAIQTSLEKDVRMLQKRLTNQRRYFDQELAEQENALREIRRENVELRTYVLMLKRWAIDAVESTGAGADAIHPLPPDFDTWVKARRASPTGGDDTQ